MTALLVAAALAILLTELTKDRHVYGCTLCSLGVVWSGDCWKHVGGKVDAPNERYPGTHPAIPDHH